MQNEQDENPNEMHIVQWVILFLFVVTVICLVADQVERQQRQHAMWNANDHLFTDDYDDANVPFIDDCFFEGVLK